MSEAQAADSRARRNNRIGLCLLVRFRLSQGMFSGRRAPENAEVTGMCGAQRNTCLVN
jgi:hypothetical protein